MPKLEIASGNYFLSVKFCAHSGRKQLLLVNFDDKYQIRDIFFPHVGQENHTEGFPFRFGVWAASHICKKTKAIQQTSTIE